MNQTTTRQRIKKFNVCRIFRLVNYLSEITTIDGKMLDPNIIDAKTTQRFLSNLIWHNQPQPTSKFWNKWINAIKQKYCITGSLKLKEQFTLGNWVQPSHKLTHRYEWIFSPRLLEVYDNL